MAGKLGVALANPNSGSHVPRKLQAHPSQSVRRVRPPELDCPPPPPDVNRLALIINIRGAATVRPWYIIPFRLLAANNGGHQARLPTGPASARCHDPHDCRKARKFGRVARSEFAHGPAAVNFYCN